jgi:type I restriction enzyme, S subunit
MSEGLKKGWTKVAFGDVVRLVKERSNDPEKDGFERYVGLEHLDPGELKIRRWGDITNGTTFTSIFRAGQVLFGKRRSYQRKLAVADFDGVCSGDIYVFEPQNDQLLPELLPFICQTDSFFEHAIGTSAGSLSPRTNWKSLAEYEFALPPMDQQEMLAIILDAMGHSKEKFDKARNQANLIKQSYLEQVINETWKLVKISDVAQVFTGKTPPTSKLEYWKDEVDFATPADFIYDTGELYITERKISEEGIAKSKVVQAKATLVVCIGSTIGKVAQTIKRTAFNQQINAVICHSVDPDYFYAISTRLGQELNKLSGNTAVPIINKSEFENIRIPLPPLEKQIEVGKFYKKLALAERAIKDRLVGFLADRNDFVNRVLLRG